MQASLLHLLFSVKTHTSLSFLFGALAAACCSRVYLNVHVSSTAATTSRCSTIFVRKYIEMQTIKNEIISLVKLM